MRLFNLIVSKTYDVSEITWKMSASMALALLKAIAIVNILRCGVDSIQCFTLRFKGSLLKWRQNHCLWLSLVSKGTWVCVVPLSKARHQV